MKILLLKPLTHWASLLYSSWDIVPDIGYGYLTTALRREGMDADILDPNIEHLPDMLTYRRIVKGGYDLIGIKIYTVSLERVIKYLRDIRPLLPHTVLVGGGPHPSGDPENVLDLLPQLDFAFKGEGEVGFPLLARLVKEYRRANLIPARELAQVPGLIWRDNGEVRTNPPVFMDDLDSLGFPAWDAVHPEKYDHEYWMGGRYVPLFTTRGCPFNCSYCGARTVVGRKLRLRSPGHVVEEVEFLHKHYGVNRFRIADDNFSMYRSHVAAFCEELLRRDLNVTWDCSSNGIRFDTLDPELLRLMERSGCDILTVAVESGSNRVLKLMQRQCTVEDIYYYTDMIRRHSKMLINTFNIMGYPGETVEDLWATIRINHKLDIDTAVFFMYTPHPGTEAAETLRQEVGIAKFDWATCKYNRISYTPPGLSEFQFRMLHTWANLSFYLRPRGMRGLWRHIDSPEKLMHFIRGTFFFVLGV